ncbi:MAG: biopolymer transporter ExbD [Thermodesulfobacteriota bacterium]
MNKSRRLKRMERSRKSVLKLNLTSLMDVFTILVFFLLFNSASGDVLEAPREIKLPDSAIDAKPRETVVVLVTPTQVLVQGRLVASTPEIRESKEMGVPAIKEHLEQLELNIIGISTKAVVEAKEITVLADKGIPFNVLKKIMSTCTSAGYGKISLAVNQKASQD